MSNRSARNLLLEAVSPTSSFEVAKCALESSLENYEISWRPRFGNLHAAKCSDYDHFEGQTISIRSANFSICYLLLNELITSTCALSKNTEKIAFVCCLEDTKDF